jgi:hypothetical protein
LGQAFSRLAFFSRLVAPPSPLKAVILPLILQSCHSERSEESPQLQLLLLVIPTRGG